MVRNLITLYDSNETEFNTNGLGNLGDAASCVVSEERNGSFDLSMEYPVKGRHFSDLKMRRIIFAKPNPYDDPQPFRIYDISTPIHGNVTVSAHHISYDLAGYTLAPFEADGLVAIFEEINRQMEEPQNDKQPPFAFSTTKEGSEGYMILPAPCSVRSLLGGTTGSILDTWPGEYKWDRWNVVYYQNRGADRGVTIEYGKNLTDLKQEENCENCWTSVYPYYYKAETDNEAAVLVQLTEKVIDFPGEYDHRRTLILDLTNEFESTPSEEDLRDLTMEYIEANELDKPDVSLTVSFASLANTVNYAKFKNLEEVRLCDIVHVYFPALNISSSSMCISTKYNVLTDKYTEVQLGKAESNLATTIAGQSSSIQQQTSAVDDKLFTFQTEVNFGIQRAVKQGTGNLGGNVVLYDSDGDGKPDTLFILETDDLTAPQNVLRWNSEGLKHSSAGYLGPFDDTIIFMDGTINSAFVR